MDDLYERIEKNEKLNKKIKLIGIAAGNSEMEAKIYGESFKVPFPLFADDDFSVHKKLGQVKTPHFFVVQIKDDQSHKVIFSKTGAFKDADEFLKTLLKLSGLE